MISYSIKRLLGLHLGLAVAFPILSPLTGRAGDQLAAQPPPPPPVTKIPEGNFLSFWDGRLVIDIEERVRVEWRENTRDFDSSLSDDNDDSWILNRFRFGLAVKPVSWLRIYGQSQDSREADSDRANIPGIRSAEGDDEWDLRQGYVALGDLKKFPLLFTVGRQAISYGDGRLSVRFKVGKLWAHLRCSPAPLGKTVLLLGRSLCHAPGPDPAARVQ